MILDANLKIFKYTQPFELESGAVLPALDIAYHTFGELNEAKDNVIWVCHALTANSDVSDWWSGLFGQGKLLDPTQYFIVCANVLGSCYGSTQALSQNPSTSQPYYHDFPLITIRDIVQSLDLLREHLNIEKIALCIGGSMGGQQALEWAILQPAIFENLVVLATNAFHSAWGIAFNESQRMAIQADNTWLESHSQAGLAGMRAARAIALLSYRNYQTYVETQREESLAITDNYKASSYQQHQGDKLMRRFNAFSYWTLTKTMDSHHVGRGRGSTENALNLIKANTLVIGISSDLLFPVFEQKYIAEHIPNARYVEIDSFYGHDGFLIENEKIEQIVSEWANRLETVQSFI